MYCVDLHVHFLPAFDDGAESFEETVEMLRLAHRSGTRTLVATPHMFLPPFNYRDPALVETAFRDLRENLAGRSRVPGDGFLQELSLFHGAENYLSTEFLAALARREVQPLAGSRCLLLELPLDTSLDVAKRAVERVTACGYVALLAHVERYGFVRRQPAHLAELVQRGAVAQLNASALLGEEGRGSRRVAETLVDRGLIYIIASDGHSARERRPELGTARQVLEGRYPPEQIRSWFRTNAETLLDEGLL